MSYTSEVLADSPLAWYRLGDASGAITDSSGNGRTGGAASGSVTYGATSLLTGELTNNCMDFSGGWVDTAYASWMDVTAITVENWVRVDTGTQRGMVDRDDGGNRVFQWRTNSKAEAVVFNSAGSNATCSGATTLVNGTTYHVAFTYDGSVIRVYVNGVLDGSTAFAAPIKVAAARMVIGSLRAGGGSPGTWSMDGRIDEVAIYGTVLSASRLYAHYAAGLSYSSAPGVPSSVTGYGTNLKATQSWSAPVSGGMAVSYEVRLNGGAPVDVGGVLTYTHTGLAANTAYTLEVRAKNPAGTSAWVSTSVTTWSTSVPYSSVILADSPLAYWRLNDSSGTTMVDSSGNSRNGTYAATKDAATGLLWNDADGATTQRATVTSAAWMDVPSITIEAIVKPSPATADQGIFARFGATLDWILWTNYPTVSVAAVRFYNTGGSQVDLVPAIAAPVAGTTYHVAATYTSGSAKLYVNGALAASSTALTGNLRMGASDIDIANYGSSHLYTGTIDEVAIYSGVLSAERVATHYDAYLAGLEVTPGVPESVVATGAILKVIQSWAVPLSSAGGKPTSYEVRLNGGTPIDVGNVLTYTHTSLAQNTLYTLEVRAKNSSGTSAWVSKTATTLNTSTAYDVEVTADSPIAYYRLADTSGNISDSSGNARHVPWLGSEYVRNQPGLLLGDSNTCVDFLGTGYLASGYGSLAYDATWMNTIRGFDCLIKPDGTAGVIFARDDETNRSFLFGISAQKIYVTWWNEPTGGPTTLTGATTLGLGYTAHVGATLSGGVWRIYVNGAVDATSAGGQSIKVTTAPITVGAPGYWHGNPKFDGKIDELAVYATPPSTARLNAHFVSAGSPMTLTEGRISGMLTEVAVRMEPDAKFSGMATEVAVRLEPDAWLSDLLVQVATKVPLPPGVPTNVAVVPTDTTLTLSWDPPVTGDPPVSYEVRLNGGTPIAGAVSPHLFINRPPSTLHDLEVRAIGVTGLTSDWVLVVARTSDAPQPPGVPIEFRVTRAYPNALRVDWAAPVTGGPVDHYEVCINRGSGPSGPVGPGPWQTVDPNAMLEVLPAGATAAAERVAEGWMAITDPDVVPDNDTIDIVMPLPELTESTSIEVEVNWKFGSDPTQRYIQVMTTTSATDSTEAYDATWWQLYDGPVAGTGPTAVTVTYAVHAGVGEFDNAVTDTLPGKFLMLEAPNKGGFGLVRWRTVPAPATITSDVQLTRGRVVANPPGTVDDIDVFVNLPDDGPITLKTTSAGYGTFLYPVEYEGLDASGTDFIPATPLGYELTDLRPFIKAHTAAGSQTAITDDTSGWGETPPPTLSPYLRTNASDPLTFSAFPAGSDPADVILCGAWIPSPFTDEQYQSALQSTKWSGTASTCDIVLSQYGWRYTFTSTTDPGGGGGLEAGCFEEPLDTPRHLFTGLSLGTYYDLEVRAVGPYGVSAWVRINEATLPGDTPVGGPVDPIIGGGPDPIFGARVHPVKYLYAMANARTGELIAALPLTAVNYSIGMFSGQELSGSVYLPDMFLEQMAHPPLNIHEHWPHPDRGIPLGSMFEVGNVAIYVIRNGEVIWGGMLWSRAYSSGNKTMAITALSWDAYVYYRALRKSVVFLNPTDKYTIWRALLNQVLHPSQGDFGWQGDAGLNSGNVSAEGGAVVPWTGIYDGTGLGNQPVTDYVERWPNSAPPIEVPPAGLVSGLDPVTIDESWRGYDMDTVGTQLEQFANTNNLLNTQGFDYRVLCWWDGNQARFRQRYTFGEMTYVEGEDADDYTGVPVSIRQPLFGQAHEDAENTIFDFPGHIRDWSLAESMENAATRLIVTGAGEQASKIAAYASDAESLGGTDGFGAGGWLLFDKVFNYDTSRYTDIQDRANKLLSLHHVPSAAQIDDIDNANSSTTQRASQRSTDLSVTLYVDPATQFPPWKLGDWVTFAIDDPLYGGVMYLQRRIIRYSVTVLPDHESDYSHEQITLELTDDTKTEAGG